MRTLMLLGWLLVPVLAGAYHYGPGQKRAALDDLTMVLAAADELAAAGQWAQAANGYDRALETLPEDRVAETRRVRLERAKAQLNGQMLASAHADLSALMEEVAGDPKADSALASGTREALANAQYYMTWLMRLEGQPKDVWGPEIDGARQNYRLIAEESASQEAREDLESAVRLARMDLAELQGLKLPSQCQGCKSCDKPGNGQCKSKGKTPAKKEGPKDARGASSGPPPDNSGQ